MPYKSSIDDFLRGELVLVFGVYSLPAVNDQGFCMELTCDYWKYSISDAVKNVEIQEPFSRFWIRRSWDLVYTS